MGCFVNSVVAGCLWVLLSGCRPAGSKTSGGEGEALGSSGAVKTSQEQSSASEETDAREGDAGKGEVRVGAAAPDFSARAHTGETISLTSLRGRAVVLYFYPKDGTPGCTVEAEQFRENHDAFKSAGAVVVGVSSDDNESHKSFAEELQLPFVLLPDPDRKIAKAYGVGGFLGMSRRVTFLIDAAGRIAKIYPSVSPKEHASEILSDLSALGIEAGDAPTGR